MSNLRSPVKRKKDCGEIQETFPIIGPVLIRCVEGMGSQISHYSIRKTYSFFKYPKIDLCLFSCPYGLLQGSSSAFCENGEWSGGYVSCITLI